MQLCLYEIGFSLINNSFKGISNGSPDNQNFIVTELRKVYQCDRTIKRHNKIKTNNIWQSIETINASVTLY